MLNIKTLTDTLSGMDLQELQDYATVNKNDPYIVSMALSMANTKKKMDIAQKGQAGMHPQPKVVDQELAQMTPQQMLPEDQGIATLPATNMQNMAGGGIVAFDDGGEVPGYAKGTFTGTELTPYIEKYAQEYKINPSVLSRIVQAESRGKTTAKNPESTAHGAGQLLDNMWKKMGGGNRQDAETQVRNAAKLLRSNNDNFKNATGREPSASEAYVTWVLGDSTGRAVLAADPKASVEEVIKKADPKLGDDIIKSNASIFKNKSVGDVTQWAANKTKLPSAVPISTATATPTNPAIDQIPGQSVKAPAPQAASQDQGIAALTSDPATGFSMPQDVFSPSPEEERKYAAAQAQAKKVGDVVSQIPGQSVQAPAAKDESSFFGDLADRLGLSQEAQRNIANTLMAPTPLAPVTTLPKAAKSSGLAALGEKIYDKFAPATGMSQKEIAALRAETEAARAAEIAQASQLPQRLTPPAQVLEQGSQVIPVTKTGEAVVQSAADLEKARGVNQAIDQMEATQRAAKLAQEASKFPSAAERLQQASYLRESDEAARLMGRANTATNAKTALQLGASAANAPEGIAALTPNENIGESVFDPTFGGTLPADAKKDIVDKLKETTGASTAELKKQAADSGMDWNSFLIRFGLGLMAGESQYASVNVGKAGLGALDAELASQKSKQAQALNLSEIGYKQAATKKATAEADYLDRFGKDKNLSLEAEKLVAQRMKELSPLMQAQLAGDPARLTAVEANIRKEIYRQLGIESTMAAGAPAPAGGFSVVGSRPG